MIKRTALIFPALALLLLVSCENAGREETRRPTGTLQSFGEAVVLALGSGDGQIYNEELCLSCEEYNELQLTLEMGSAEERKRQYSELPFFWERNRIEEKRLAAWDETLAAGTAEGVEWENVHFESVRHQPLDGAHQLDRFFVSLDHLSTRPADVYVVFSDDQHRNFEVHLDDCIETPNGWRSASGIHWLGNIDARGRTDCLENLRKIYSAKEQLSFDVDLNDGDAITAEQLAPYLKPRRGLDPLRCPSGGQYSINAYGTSPGCSLHGDGNE